MFDTINWRTLGDDDIYFTVHGKAIFLRIVDNSCGQSAEIELTADEFCAMRSAVEEAQAKAREEA